MRLKVLPCLPCARLSLFAVLIVTGCSGGAVSPSAPPQTPSVTATTLSVSTLNASSGSAITLSSVTKLASGTAASGSATFLDSSVSLGTVAVDQTGAASLSVSTLTPGLHSITAAFAATSTESASASAATLITVTQPMSTVVLIKSSASILGVGFPIELVANVSPLTGTSVATGLVTFNDGAMTVGSAMLDSTGRAIVTTLKLTSGPHSIVASYSGNSNLNGSTSAALLLTVAAVPGPLTYTNPLNLNTPGGLGVNCADPASIKVQTGGVNTWYLYCTSDVLYSGDTASHYINIFESKDLINFYYDGSAFTRNPFWAPNGPLYAPAIRYVNGRYMLYYATPSSNIAPTNGAAIGVGVSASPIGPFVDSGSPVVEPEPTSGNCCGGRARATIDPDVVTYNGQGYVTFGSFDGGIFIRALSADGLQSDPSTETLIAASNRYEGGTLWQHAGFYYLFASSANCCNGPLTGYSVFVGRALTPLGPFLEKSGTPMTSTNTGGTEVLAQNGNNWIGPGGNTLFTDESGLDYMLYHAVSLATPVVMGTPGHTARPALLDAVEWGTDGWPTVRGGFGPSATAQPAPAAQPLNINAYKTNTQINDLPGTAIAALSDEFNASTLSTQWSPMHSSPAYTFSNGTINLPTVSLDSCCQMATLPILAEPAPMTDYMVETKLTMNFPTSASTINYAQGDLFIYGDDSNFLRLDLYANAATRQVEFLKQMAKLPAYDVVNGVSNLSQPLLSAESVVVYLRIAKRTVDGQATYTAYASQDGLVYTRGATWQHTLNNEKIGIAASNLAGYTASFDYVHVTTLQ